VYFIQAPPPDATISEIAPIEALRSGRLSMCNGTIEADYRMGRKAGEDFLSLRNISKNPTHKGELST
jgi:predicted patatin/cPLA2 family phospholipase